MDPLPEEKEPTMSEISDIKEGGSQMGISSYNWDAVNERYVQVE